MAERKMKVPINIKKINLVNSWNIIADPKDEKDIYTCKLCKRLLLAPPLDELNTNTNKDIKIESMLSKGKCGDIFHEKCINNSIKSGCISCPTCNVPWNQLKTLRSDIILGNLEQLSIKKKTTNA